MSFSQQSGLDWAGEYSRWNFDEEKAYLMVAKMQKEPGTANGIPLLDSELNENTEILLTLIRRLIKRIHGNGTNGKGFQIQQSSANPNNNFTIAGGDGTAANAGFIFVDGWMPFNLSNLEYTGQSYGPTALTTPVADRVDEVYIDVYYKEVSFNEDGAIKDMTVNLETSRRIGLVWEVKVAEGGQVPSNYVDGNNIQHYCHHLATLNRPAGNSTITTDMIVDYRNHDRLIKREHIHEQTTTASSWTVKHALGTKRLVITVFEGTTRDELEPAITYNDDNTITLSFGSATVSGTAMIVAVDG